MTSLKRQDPCFPVSPPCPAARICYSCWWKTDSAGRTCALADFSPLLILHPLHSSWITLVYLTLTPQAWVPTISLGSPLCGELVRMFSKLLLTQRLPKSAVLCLRPQDDWPPGALPAAFPALKNVPVAGKADSMWPWASPFPDPARFLFRKKVLRQEVTPRDLSSLTSMRMSSQQGGFKPLEKTSSG